jgi:ElaB/YqjD/DUF883 family membrane-anchored ribosome-binding protein
MLHEEVNSLRTETAMATLNSDLVNDASHSANVVLRKSANAAVERGEDAIERARSIAEDLLSQAGDLLARGIKIVKKNPVAAVGIAVGIGAVLTVFGASLRAERD